jgi:thiol:disulfide interchange protein DsbD
MTLRILYAFLTFSLFLSPAGAQFSFSLGGDDDVKTSARLVPEVSTFAPGETFSVAIALKHPSEWHSYYQNSGGIELPLAVEWVLPAGFSAGEIQWPVPQVKDGYFGKSFIYEGEPVFVIDLTALADAAQNQEFTFTASASWQICKEACIDENAEFTFTLISAGETTIDPNATTLFDRARAAQPLPSDGWKIQATSGGSDVTLTLDGTEGDSVNFVPVEFVPDVPFIAALSEGGLLEQDDSSWTLTLKRKIIDFLDNEIPQGDGFSGILINEEGRGMAIPETAIQVESKPLESLSFAGLLPILGGMFLGGLILNLMPCVFPVIGIKIMGFVQQAGEDRRKIILHGLVFTLGVLASFAVLAGVLFAVRQAVGGDAIGWGYQLQQPWVVLSLMLLMFLLAMNLYGIFEIGTSATSVGGSLQMKQGIAGSFFSGVLATVVATPCSGPFLGAAIGAAIGLPAVQFFSAFTAMALGLATPYLVLSIFPKLIDLLPRPGAWMESFKQGMSFLLFATAGYLLWVYAGLIGLEYLLGPVFGLSAVAIAGWVYGRWCPPNRKPKTRLTGIAFTIAFAVAGIWMIKPPQPSELVWQDWSPEKVAELHAEGRPVFIDFTAQWCATCQVNKKIAYTDEVIAMMNERGIIALRADKTRPNPAIDARLEELGRTAIPVNVLHLPGEEPIITPEVLRPGYLLELFGNVGNE